jgi:ketosteroid isomerase-like protein
MTPRTAVLALALAAAVAGCSPKRIPGTQIESTPDTVAVHDVVRSYRQALEKRDVQAVLALVAPTYFDTAGTSDPSDDLDRAALEAALAQDMARAEGVRVDFTLRKIDVAGEDAEAELFYETYYRVQTPGGPKPRSDSDIHRIKLKKLGGDWKIVAGL